MKTNNTALVICLLLAGLLFLGGGLALGLILSQDESLPHLQPQALAPPPPIDMVQAALPVDPKDEIIAPVLQEEKPVLFQPKPKIPEDPLPPGFEGPPALPLPPPPPPPAGMDQKQIDDAIARGVKYLKAHQNLNSTWGGGGVPAVGYTALPGLTLLECGVSAKDPVVQKAAAYVRKNVPNLNSAKTTYEISLAILFLDRLGEPRDKDLIRTMAMRLVAGQTAAGGWDYRLPILDKAHSDQLFAFLEKTQSYTSLPDPLTASQPNAKTNSAKNITTATESSIPEISTGNKDTRGEVVKPSLPKDENPSPNPQPLGPNLDKAPKKVLPKGQTLRPDFLPPNLRNIPAVVNQGKGKGKGGLKTGRDDNSNSQFAMLALWTAHRHGVPTDQTLLLAYQRYVTSQTSGGGWYYEKSHPNQTPSMTCVGLLGLAMGHGSGPDIAQGKGPKVAGKTLNEDPAIQKGLKALGSYLGQTSQGQKPPMENLYFLWSVERVAMLYNLKTIGAKDWYGWGARILVLNQMDEGNWHSQMYPGTAPTIDTCFALLFLKRSNLVQDLTDNLQLFMAISDPDARKK